MELKNYKEYAVDHVLPNLLRAFPDICKCDKCLMDIKAIALNNLEPQYVVTDKGGLYAQVKEMSLQYEANIMKAVLDGISVVSEHPMHEIKKDV
ncbi:MAG: late competence development ComFB family protein [Clostridiales bacterium]|nr:late competence development ComFB family protein [Clostridiales bacterium]